MSLLVPSARPAPPPPDTGIHYEAVAPCCGAMVLWHGRPLDARAATVAEPVEHVCEPERTEQQR